MRFSTKNYLVLTSISFPLFNKKNDNIDITVNSSCDWKIASYPNDLITITKTSYSSKERSFTITSNSEGEFENQEIIVSNCSGLTETIYVSQKTSYSSLNMLVVNPQVINLKGNDSGTGATYTPPTPIEPYLDRSRTNWYLVNPLGYKVSVTLRHVISGSMGVVTNETVTKSVAANSEINLTWPTASGNPAHTVTIEDWNRDYT